MKKTLLLFILTLSVLSALAGRDVKFYMSNGEIKCIAQDRIDSLFFDESEDFLILSFEGRVESLVMDDIDSIKYGTLPQMVTVEYIGDRAFVENPFAFDSVGVSIVGAKVVITSLTTREIDYCLQGVGSDGCFKIYGSRKYNLFLNGLSLANSNGAAINSQCKKRARVFVNEGTVNTLTDAARYNTVSGEDEKGAFFSEGQIIFEGSGRLVINGLCKHALCSDDYLDVRGATIEVASAVGDDSDFFHIKYKLLQNL